MWSEVWTFLRVRKRYWLLPALIVAAILAALAIFAGPSPDSPFLYTLF
jgi:hypothetical protein